MTDVTGFGLLGHLHGLLRASGLAAEVEAALVPALEGAEELLRDGDAAVSGGSARNAAHAEGFATIAPGVPAWRRRLVTDATTSGGLLVAVPEDAAAAIPGVRVGRLVAGPPGALSVV
jgi:selenide,water dikinase